MRTARHRGDAELAIAALELLDDCGRKRDAAAIADAALATNPGDARLHAYAGMLDIQLGEFERARRHYLSALECDTRAWEWHVPLGLSAAQRYASRQHPDFTLLAGGLRREGLSDNARAELHFALGKAYDDVADYGAAADQFRQGNAIAGHLANWSRKAWRRAVQARLTAAPSEVHAAPTAGFTPIFIVSMPRSGTTLLATLLARHAGICNRGELPWIAMLAERPEFAGRATARQWRDAASLYATQARRDDAEDATWFIDKQPLNFRYVDLMLAMFPDARILHCRRGARDTALSLWRQRFLEPVHGYSYAFNDIAVVMDDCTRLMAHWCARYPASIQVVDYERLVAKPDQVTTALADWIGLPPVGEHGIAMPSSISTASLWQARQPVHAHSVRLSDRYLSYVPELARWPAP
jgi:tetratricopeptide (TPR) repeat protein